MEQFFQREENKEGREKGKEQHRESFLSPHKKQGSLRNVPRATFQFSE
jgi:hypothetical protein